MRQCGVVTSVNGNAAKVLIQRSASCGDCTACKMGQENMKIEVEALNEAKAQMGQRVEVDMEHQNVLTAAFIVYVIPLVTLVLGIALGSLILGSLGVVAYKDLLSALIGFGLTAAAFVAIRMRESKIKEMKGFVPVITNIIE